MFKDFKIMVLIYGIFALIVALAAYSIAYGKCWSAWSGTDIDWRMSRFTCQVKTNDLGWIPADRFRHFD